MIGSPYSVYLVDPMGIRRFVCRRPLIEQCAEIADKLLHGSPGRIVEVLEDAPGGATPVSITVDPPKVGRRPYRVS